MRNKLHIKNTSPLALIMAAALLAAAAPTEGAVPVVHLEKTRTLGETWQAVPAAKLVTTPEGGLMDATDTEAVFYRLRVQRADPSGIPMGLALSEVPKDALSIAQDHLSNSQEDDWEHAQLGPIVYPVYNPAINGNTAPAYLEFKVIRQPAPAPASPFNGSPLDQKADLGFILVSLTRQDVPIPEFSTDGLTRVEKLRSLAKTSQVKAVRYSQAILVAENAKGEAVASLGATPFQFPEAILDFTRTNQTESIVQDGNQLIAPAIANFSGSPYNSFAQFKDDYLNGPLYPKLRAFQALAAKTAWLLRDGTPPALIQVGLQYVTNILSSKPISRFDVEDPAIVSLQMVPGQSGLLATGLKSGGTLLHVCYTGGDGDTFVIQVGAPAMQAKGWGSWHTYYAGSWGDQKYYYQEPGLAGCCPSGYSGCGPTAWAMFYGYWDGLGVTTLIGGSGGTPMYNNSYVDSCIQYVFVRVGTYCVGSEAATNPWQMNQGYQWAGHQGASISITTDWGVPYVSSGPRNKAIQSIRDYGRPAIVGTGFYAHYPLAYGYKYRTWTSWGITWDTQRYWKVNNGQGDTSPIWVDADSCWFGSNGYCY